VAVSSGAGINGVILVDLLKSVDWKARHAERAGRCPGEAMEIVRAKLAPLLGY